MRSGRIWRWGAAGALILVLIFNIVIILGLPVQAQMIIKGFIIIIAAALFAKAIKA